MSRLLSPLALLTLLLLTACARIEPLEPEERAFTLTRDAWVKPCELQNSTFSMWFSRNSAWCLRFDEAPQNLNPAWKLPAGTRLRVLEKRRLAGVDADWLLYRLKPPPGLPPTPGGLYVRDYMLEVNRQVRQQLNPGG